MSEKSLAKTSSFDICCECRASCCQDAKPPLTKDRKRIIITYLRKQDIRIRQPFADGMYSYPSVDKLGFCVFYNKPFKKCIIHEVKPETCKAGPITFDINRDSGKVEFFLKEGEICIFAPHLVQNDREFRKHFQAAKRELIRLIRSLETSALLAILKIDEPQTFKIGEAPLPKRVAGQLKI